MDKRNIKWGCIQPLTGGMYIGAYEALGHHAEWILSYSGLDSVKSKDGKIVFAGNEYNLLKWLEKNGANVPYYNFINRDMFSDDTCNPCPTIQLNGIDAMPDYKDIDIVVAVPVCSGLSMATRAGNATKESRNCNMEWLAFYALNVIKPKVYCFENAPGLVGAKGENVRMELEDIARNAGYSVLYYKTDTKFHHNCQRRPRTFVIFAKWRDGQMQEPPLFEYEHETILVPEFFDNISENASQQVSVRSAIHNYIAIDFMKNKYGENWIENLKVNNVITHIINNELDDFKKFVADCEYSDVEKEKTMKYINHILLKKSMGLNYYGDDAAIFFDLFPSVQFRSMPNMLHYSGKRFCTIREYLSLMGMPEDFELYGNESCLSKIGQNVPVKTAKFIVEQIFNTIDNWETSKRDIGNNALMQDNNSSKTKKI